MKKVVGLLILLGLNIVITNGQTLFTYGGKAVSKQSFLAAFNKNPTPETERRKALDEYLNLYINYKLKVQSGYDEGLDKQSSFQLESNNFKQQIAENLINEEAGITMLVNEAFQRSQKDIHAAHIFIEASKNGDTLKAFQQIQAAYKALLTGRDFSDVAAEFSSDEATKNVKGDLGFITVFTLQYPIENQIYNLSPNKFSKPFHSNFGYHIFKNIEERPAAGKRKIAQLLIAVSPNATSGEKQKMGKLADSVYNLITHGELFEDAVLKFSNDTRTANTGGVLGEISVGQFDADYDANIFALKQVGGVSKPFFTSYGYHLIKLLETTPVSKNLQDGKTNVAIKQLIEKDARLITFKNANIKKWQTIAQYKKTGYSTNDVWIFADSALQKKTIKKLNGITDSTVLFYFPKQKIYVTDWLQYLVKENVTNRQLYAKKMLDFEDANVVNYYTNHLEDFNTTMHQQVEEFSEANILFAAMDKHVWSRSGDDIDGLKKYYSLHKSKYQWDAGISALVITCNSKKLTDEVLDKIKAAPSNWQLITASYGTSVIADSSRYEQQQLPIKQVVQNTIGFTSLPEKNSNDDSYTFLYITALHPQKEQRSFDEARGMVINDYQQVLEQQWLGTLKKKYPVKINETTWKSIK